MADSGRRLTSWKEIASYFGREVRTVMRWEKDRALPVHRGGGSKTGVVFADTNELDAWARGAAPSPEEPSAEPIPVPTPVPEPTRLPARAVWLSLAAAAVVVLVGAGAWRLRGGEAGAFAGDVVLTADAVIGRNDLGLTRWRYDFPGETITPPFARTTNAVERLGDGTVLVGISDIVRSQDAVVRGGQLLMFDAAGRMTRSFAFNDRVSIGAREFLPPWVVADYQVLGDSPQQQIAVAGHHYEWWPSVVTVLDADWRRRGSFVNAGWVEHLRWLSGTRLAISGFSNEKDAGMVALLDVEAMNGQSPGAGGTFACATCGPDRPLRYVVMPRSEVNRVSAAPFNRASVSVRSGALLVRTVEMPQGGDAAPADAEYEFSLDLELRRATFGDRYWEAHRELERLGKITHARTACPERDGPRQIEEWDAALGWRARTPPEPIRP